MTITTDAPKPAIAEAPVPKPTLIKGVVAYVAKAAPIYPRIDFIGRPIERPVFDELCSLLLEKFGDGRIKYIMETELGDDQAHLEASFFLAMDLGRKNTDAVFATVRAAIGDRIECIHGPVPDDEDDG